MIFTVLLLVDKENFHSNFDFVCTVPRVEDKMLLSENLFQICYFIVVLFLLLINLGEIIITYLLIYQQEGCGAVGKFKFLILFFIFPALFYSIDLLNTLNLVEENWLRYSDLFVRELMGPVLGLILGMKKSLKRGVSNYVKFLKGKVSHDIYIDEEEVRRYSSNSDSKKSDKIVKNFTLSEEDL